MFQSESRPGKATVGEWQDSWDLHTIQGGHTPAWGMENVCALLYQPDVDVFFMSSWIFILVLRESESLYWPVRAVVVVNTVVKVGKLVDAEPLVDRVVLVLQARLEKKIR